MILAYVMVGLAAAGPPPPAVPPAPLRIDVLAKPCADSDTADVTVCARRTDTYRIDPGVLAGQRARDQAAIDLRSPQERAIVRDCTAEQDRCQGSGVIPILPVAMKAVTAAVLAVKGNDWREPFRTKPDEYGAYQAEQARRRSRISVAVQAGSGSGAGGPP